MRYAIAILSAIAVVAIAHDTTMLDESMDLLQESATVELATAAHAKVAVKSEDTSKVKEGGKAALEERATVMIGTHELDAEQVSMAKHALSKITMKLGVRHPIFLGEAAGIADFTSDKAKYVKGGYGKLKKILIKIDEFNTKLEDERQKAIDDRELVYTRCTKEIGDDFQSDVEATNQAKAAARQQQEADFTAIQQKHAKISTDLGSESGQADQIYASINTVSTEYREYWEATEDRHQVRNVLMQALWLVCTNFATFRHTQYCTNIRQQPDFDEPSTIGMVEEESQSAGSPAYNEFRSYKTESDNFGQTMQPVWEQQKVADADEVNSLDGDVDMEKGFVNNRAPWGVDPEGMDARATSGKHEEGDDRTLEGELGESTESHAHDMTNEEMSSRLTFLVESSSVPERISVPITAFIQALDSDDTAVQGGLVEALVKMDTAEGQAQSNLDYTWYQDSMAQRQSMWDKLQLAQSDKATQLADFEAIETLHSGMAQAVADEVQRLADFRTMVGGNAAASSTCDSDLIEIEALIEVCNEELTNIMRLNSLLRYLVIGERAVCSDSEWPDCQNPTEGSCTWKNRGGTEQDQDENGSGFRCETETGQDIPCKYGESRHNQFNVGGMVQDKFCACEYGYFGVQGGATPTMNSKACNKKSCPGYGRIRYPGNGVHALQVMTMDGGFIKLSVTNQQYDLRTNPANGNDSPYSGPTHFLPMAVCSSIKLREHGTCDISEGKCTECFVQPPALEDGTDGAGNLVVTPNLERSNGIIVVPTSVTQAMPYNGAKLKCEEWLVRQARLPGSWDQYAYTEASDPSVCTGRGQPKRNFMGFTTGECVCDPEYYGETCQYFKCQMDGTDGPYYEADSPVVCHGRGQCKFQVDGKCECENMATGDYCERKRCPGYDPNDSNGVVEDPECGSGVGECNFNSGRCQCAQGASCGIDAASQTGGCPGTCIYADCQANCQGGSSDGATSVGLCDRFSGLCMCNPSGIFNGPACVTPSRGDMKSIQWSTSMDKWGWSICPPGHLLVGMKTDQRGSMDALFNLDIGVCQAPFEAASAITRAVENYRCYHENWWKKFDSRGGKFCRRNYFVAGLFRSHCNSLYCIEMAKCCSVKRSLWTSCSWTPTANWVSNAAGMTVSGTTGFIVGFFRDKLHTLAGITSLRQCSPIWYGQLYKYKTRFDN